MQTCKQYNGQDHLEVNTKMAKLFLMVSVHLINNNEETKSILFLILDPLFNNFTTIAKLNLFEQALSNDRNYATMLLTKTL